MEGVRQRQETREGGKVMKQQQMVKLSVEVRSGTARFRVGVQAKSIRHALTLVEGRYPHGVVRVHFPIEPETFFVTGPSSPAGVAEPEHAHPEAA
jgi:hypothetical protein